ncbi:hypothetical protein EG329_001977 [Mollisiaceae sp. DMI_Dod_QoI]|nr:hypothetical protein EG329_001977 [Helotiales sp. DMI_Dod_QoI]
MSTFTKMGGTTILTNEPYEDDLSSLDDKTNTSDSSHSSKERSFPKDNRFLRCSSNLVPRANMPNSGAFTTLSAPKCPELDPASKVLKEFLLKSSSEFVRVNNLREKGWFENKEKGDAFFAAQREKADHADKKDEKHFYDMMVQIGEEMHRVTGALAPQGVRGFKVLDICMAPGGYAAAVLKLSPGAEIYGITLDEKAGGHPLLLDDPRLKCVKRMDITMLFNLVLCDGIKLRTQRRDDWREENEATRLAVSQLILALQRINQGGTVIMLLHKVDMWPSVNILYTFSKFARVSVFKPSRKHQTRSSFYMIAQDVQPENEAAKAAVDEWKKVWWKTTCGGKESKGEKIEEPTEKFVNDVIEQFGEKLIELGHNAWRIQADALSKTDYAGDASASASASASIAGSLNLTHRREGLP